MVAWKGGKKKKKKKVGAFESERAKENCLLRWGEKIEVGNYVKLFAGNCLKKKKKKEKKKKR
jgi:hypothetical protein